MSHLNKLSKLPVQDAPKTTPADERRVRSRSAPGFASRRGKILSMGCTKSELIEKYRHQVRIIAVKMARDLPASIDVDDLFSMGFLGLLDAAEKFDPTREIQFGTYAEFRIRGSILDGLRKQDWLSRTTRERINSVRTASETLEARMGRRPSDSEVSKEMEMPLAKFQQMITELGSPALVNFSDETEGTEHEDFYLLDPFREAAKKEAKTVVDRMVGLLHEQEQSVLKLYYYRGLNLKEISQIVHLSESRVCQIHSAALLNLRKLIKNIPVESVFLALMDE